ISSDSTSGSTTQTTTEEYPGCNFDVLEQEDSSLDCYGIGLWTTDPACLTYTKCHSKLRPGVLMTCPDGEMFKPEWESCTPYCGYNVGPFVSCTKRAYKYCNCLE
ncbi:unnamed protein product, partial [Meganyctiphanes norvegica]